MSSSLGKIVSYFISKYPLMSGNPDKGHGCGTFEEVESLKEVVGQFLVVPSFPATFGDVDGGCTVDEDDWKEWWV